MTHEDVLASVFGESIAYGAIQVTATTRTLVVNSQTATTGPSGSFGEGVPAFGPEGLIAEGSSRIVPSVREDAEFRTNLLLVNAAAVDGAASVQLVSSTAKVLASKKYPLPPLGMTQVTRVVRDLGVPDDVAGAYLVVQAPDVALVAYGLVIDNGTNDPRGLLPR